MLSLEQRLDKVEGIIKKPSFRQNKGLGNEVGYYIFDYPAEQELAVREYVEYIRQKNEEVIAAGFALSYSIYTTSSFRYSKTKGILEKCFEFEKTKGFDRITKAVGNMLRITSSDSLLVNYIRERTPANSVVFTHRNRKMLSDPPLSYCTEQPPSSNRSCSGGHVLPG